MIFVPRHREQARALFLALLGSVALTLPTPADQQIYTDSLQNGWQDWSWATHDLNHTTTKHSGTKSISVNASSYSALSFWHSPQIASAFSGFSFWIHGGTSGGQTLQVYGEKDGVGLPSVTIPAPTAGTWQQVTLSLASLGLSGATNMTRFNIQSISGSTLPTFYVDDVRLISDTTPPVVQSFSPAAGTVPALTNIVVTFSESVTGVGASDLRVNGNPATGMSGSGAAYTFTFNQPPEGVVNITWTAGHGITDLSSPANAFNATGPGATWQYLMLDSVPPVLTVLFPSGGATMTALSQIEATFSEPVLGVQAADLLINGAPATNVTKLSGQPYVFKFPPPPTGNVSVAWAPGHGITDGAAAANAFAGGAWSYTLNPNLTLPDLAINEFLSSNVSTNGLADEDGSLEDWIEIYNRGSQSVNLANWSLSDDPALPGLWTFPARTLNPGQYLVIFASGKDRRATNTSENLHTNFKLAGEGEPLGLYSADSPRQLVSGFEPFPEQRNDVSYGRDLFGQLRYFATLTPGAANGLSTIVGVVEPVHVNVNRGHFTTPFALTASCPTPGAVLRYTTNGSEPTASSTLFPSSLQISNTTLFRIAGFKTNYLPAKSETHSYLFNLPEAFRSLPVVSIVTDSNNLWGPTGIMGFGPGYRNVEQHGLAWEKPISMEWIKPADHSGFQVDCGVRIQGSDYNREHSDANSKFSFRLYFKSDYGPGRLNYPLFPNTTVESFDGLVLRAGFNEQENPFIRDELHRRLSADMGQLAAHGNMAIVLLNGSYYTNAAQPWILPVYNPTERVHAEFFQEHLGGSDLWDVVKPPWQEGGGAVDGTFTDMASLVNYVDNTANVTNSADYLTISAWLDLTNFADYLVLNTYAGMGDWPGNNWRAGRDQAAAGIWRFVFWDAEWGMGIYGRSPTGINSFTGSLNDSAEISRLYRSLRDSAEFRLLWADRVQKHFFNGGALMGASITNRFRELETELAQVIPSLNPEILNWVANRWPTYVSQMTSEGLQSSVIAPNFNQHGGRVAPGFNLTLTAPAGTMYYTTNGSDPRVAFTGAVSPSALTYTGAVVLNNTVSIRARARNGVTWSAINEATFTVGSLGIPLRITEIMYNPTGGSLYEFVEMQNTSGVAVNLGGMYLDGVNFIFPDGSSLPGGARIVLGVNTDTNAWKALYTGVNPIGWFSGNLNNAGERISLFDKFGGLITSVDYSDGGGWPTAADGGGRSLEVVNASGDPDAAGNWKASAANNGTPGAANSAPPAQMVFLNEVMAENASVNHGGTFPDWIELRNPGGGSVNLTGWSLTDDGNARKFAFPSTTIPAGGHLVVWCDATTNTTPGLHTGFSLDKDGETISLYDANTNRIDALSYGLQLTNYSVGRVGGINGWTLTTPTTNALNIAATLAPASNLALNEWLANPAPGEDDWVELYNNSATLPVSLQGIYLTASNTIHQLTSLSFLRPLGYVQLLADEGVGPDHLDFKLSASGETLTLADATGGPIQSVSFSTQAEGISQGRLPDGNASVTNFIGSASPEAANYLNTYIGPVLNEVLARNKSVSVGGQLVDFVELYNPGSSFDLGGMSLSVNSQQAGEWTFPAGTVLGANSYLLIKCNGDAPASTNAGSFNTGESLDGESGGVYLFNPNGQRVNLVEYGWQVDNLSLGLSGGQWRLLSTPTPGTLNSAVAVLGTNTALRLNEWMPNPGKGDDWFELFNPTNRPVDLSTISLSDDPSLVGQGMFRPAPLSFIGANGFVKWVADANAGQGRNHVNFGLDDQGESLLVYTVVNNTNFTLIDSLGFGGQTNGVSSGRLLDGAASILAFPGTASPGYSNYRPLTNVFISEALMHTDPPLEDAIELRNPTALPVSIAGWYLSNTRDSLRKYLITNTTPIPAGGYAVIYEYQFNNGTTNAFTLNSAHGDEIWVTATTSGVDTGDRATVEFGSSFNGISYGRVQTSQGVDFWPLTTRTFGQDNPASVAQFRSGTGLSNAVPVVGPIIINEILYHPPGGTNDSDEYVELRNNTGSTVNLYDPAYPTNRWKLGGGIDFTFPASVSLSSNSHLLVVDFNPTNTTTLTAFRARYGISNSIPVYGPFTGSLDNSEDSVELYRPDTPQQPPALDAGFVPYVLADRVSYTDSAPWPGGGVDGGGLSLQRLAVNLYGNEPMNWVEATPTPGVNNSTTSPDTDGDGIPDSAEDQMGLDRNNPADAALDPDGDGMTNSQEYRAGTNHQDANSNLKLTGIALGANVTLSFQAVAGHTYSVLHASSLANPVWSKLADVPAQIANQTVIMIDPQTTAAARFYRLVTPALP